MANCCGLPEGAIQRCRLTARWLWCEAAKLKRARWTTRSALSAGCATP